MSEENETQENETSQPPPYEPLPGQAEAPKPSPVVQQPPPAMMAVQPTTTTVVVTTNGGGPKSVMLFGRDPVTMTCPYCDNNITTICEYKIGILIILLAILICFILECWCGCCLIPLCIKGFKDVVHTCPVCKNILGKSKII